MDPKEQARFWVADPGRAHHYRRPGAQVRLDPATARHKEKSGSVLSGVEPQPI